MACARLVALSKDDVNCTAEAIVELIVTDRYHLGFIDQYSTVEECLPGKIVQYCN